jgi:hypothetical protein
MQAAHGLAPPTRQDWLRHWLEADRSWRFLGAPEVVMARKTNFGAVVSLP